MKNIPLTFLLAAIVIFIVGAGVGGMAVKIQYLEQQLKNGGQNVLGAAQQPSQPSGNPSAPSAPAAPTKVDVKINPEDPIKGNPNAKLTITEFADFQCPFCGRFHSDTEPQIIKDYVDTGKAKFVYKELAILGKESTDAANAALCAKEQNKFWEYHDYLFNHQQGENQGAFSVDNLKKFADTLGLNTSQFNSCLDGQKYNSQVQADVAEANKLGFNSTPSLAVGSTPVIGAQPYAQFKAAIDQELGK